VGAQGGRALDKFASRQCFNQASLSEAGLSCLGHCNLVLGTITELRGSSALLWLRKTWRGEGTFRDQKNMSPASPLQGLGLSRYIPDPRLLWKRLCPRPCCWRAAREWGTGAGSVWRCRLSPVWWEEPPVSVLTALLFSFSVPSMVAQEISLLLVSRVSLLCDPFVW